MPNNYPLVNPPQWDQNAPVGLRGLMYSQDRGRYDHRAGMQDQMMRAQQQLTLEDLTQGAPVRQAQRDAIVRDAPVTSRNLEATTGINESNRRFQEATYDGRVGVANDQADLQRGQIANTKVHQLMAGLTAVAQLPQSPIFAQQAGQLLKRHGIDPNDPQSRQAIEQVLNGDPAQMQQRLMNVGRALSETDQPYRTAMDTTALKGQYDLEGRRISGQFGVNAAREAALRGRETAWDVFQGAKTIEEKMMGAATVYTAPQGQFSPQQKEAAKSAILLHQDVYLALAANKMVPMIPGLKTTPLPRMIGEGQSQSHGSGNPSNSNVVDWNNLPNGR